MQPVAFSLADEEQPYDCGIYYSLDWWIMAFQVRGGLRHHGLTSLRTFLPLLGCS